MKRQEEEMLKKSAGIHSFDLSTGVGDLVIQHGMWSSQAFDDCIIYIPTTGAYFLVFSGSTIPPHEGTRHPHSLYGMVPKASGTCVQEMYECIYLVSVEERERKSKQLNLSLPSAFL
jgi:hypothetical protein